MEDSAQEEPIIEGWRLCPVFGVGGWETPLYQYRRLLYKYNLELEKKSGEGDTSATPDFVCYPTLPNLQRLVENFRWLGMFPSYAFRQDPNRPKYIRDNFEQGSYYVFDMAIIFKDVGPRQAVLLVNSGHGELETGLWGCLYLLVDHLGNPILPQQGTEDIQVHLKPVVDIQSIGDYQTAVTKRDETTSGWNDYEDVSFEPTQDPEFDTNKYPELYQVAPPGENFFKKGMVPGRCRTQFEKVVGMLLVQFYIVDASKRRKMPLALRYVPGLGDLAMDWEDSSDLGVMVENLSEDDTENWSEAEYDDDLDTNLEELPPLPENWNTVDEMIHTAKMSSD